MLLGPVWVFRIIHNPESKSTPLRENKKKNILNILGFKAELNIPKAVLGYVNCTKRKNLNNQ